MVTLSEILTALELAKKAVPTLDALGAGLADLATHEKDDVRNAAVAVGKAIYDLKGSVTSLVAAVKVAAQA